MCPRIKFQYVRHGAVKESLLAFMSRRFPYHTRKTWQELILSENVIVNEKRVSPEHILNSAERIIYQQPWLPEPQVDKKFRIIYQDADLLAISKSGNIPTAPAGKYWHNCLLHVLQDKLNARHLRAVHRLDRETSGINLFAYGKDNAAILSRAFQERRVRKIYAAILKGEIKQKRVRVDAPIYQGGGRINIKQVVDQRGKPSQTNFYTVRHVQGNTLAYIRPLTGRTHQIRVHAAYIGHHVLHDKIYGENEELFLQSLKSQKKYLQSPQFSVTPASARQKLHAFRLQLQHPQTKRQLVLSDSHEQLFA